MAFVNRLAPDVQRADFVKLRRQRDFQIRLVRLAAESQNRLQRRQRRDVVVWFDDVAELVVQPRGGGVEGERDRRVGLQVERVRKLPDDAFVRITRHDAEEMLSVLRGDFQKIGVCDAAFDADGFATPRKSIERSALRNSQRKIGRFQFFRKRSAVPFGDGVADPLAEDGRDERAAVEEDLVRQGDRGGIAQRFSREFQKRENVLRDGGVRCVGQPHGLDAAAAIWRLRIDVDERKEAVENGGLDVIPFEIKGFQRREDGASFARDGDLHRLGSVFGKQFLLRAAALLAEARPLPLRKFRLPRCFRDVRERHVHVVAAQQQMFADGLAAERVVVFDFDDRQIRRAAADIDDQHDVADGDFLFPIRLIGGQPCVESGQRLFNQRQFGKAGLAGGLYCQFTGRFVKRRGNRENDLLIL